MAELEARPGRWIVALEEELVGFDVDAENDRNAIGVR